MSPSESQKKASSKWDKENMATLGCKVKKEEAEAFKEYCAAIGKTSNTVLKEHVVDCIKGLDWFQRSKITLTESTGESVDGSSDIIERG